MWGTTPSRSPPSLDDDSDDDGLLDGEEDLDGDGAVDLGSDRSQHPDTDGDGLQDGTESGVTEGGEGPGDDFVPDSDPDTTTDPLNPDSDDDGLTDGEEDEDGDGAVDDDEPDPNNPDTDGDSLQDGDEDLDGSGGVDGGETDPLEPDTDGDGIDDGIEVELGLPPSKANRAQGSARPPRAARRWGSRCSSPSAWASVADVGELRGGTWAVCRPRPAWRPPAPCAGLRVGQCFGTPPAHHGVGAR